MLRDHRQAQEQWARRKAGRRALAEAFGEFVAGLAAWEWFVTVTFRNEVTNQGRVVLEIKSWLAEIEKMAGQSFAFVLAEEFGALGGRFHCHLLIAGVADVRRDFWWREAFRRFGRTRIEPCQQARAAACYAAKYETRSLGNLHFGGALKGSEVRRVNESFELTGREQYAKRGAEIVTSASLDKKFFRMTLARR